MIIWHEEQDKDLENQISEKRDSVKYKSNSTRNTQSKSITGTAQGDWVWVTQALLEVIEYEWHKHCSRCLSVSSISTTLWSVYSDDQIL